MSLNVLVVDDSPVMRRMVRRSLGMCGLPVGEVYEAGNGGEALSLLSGRWVDLVIADVNMPEMGGVEMVERMAGDGMLARLPVVMVSSDRAEARIERLKQLGVRAYLTKPFRPEALREVVLELLPIAPAFKAEPTSALLAEIGQSGLEECAFIFARPASGSWPEEVARAEIPFDNGEVHGLLTLSAGADMGRELAAGMLGADPEDADVAESADAALGELANILAGVLVERVFGADATFRVGIPEVSRGPFDAPSGVRATLVDDGGRALDLSLAIHRSAQGSTGKSGGLA